jgi:hypothetical protein
MEEEQKSDADILAGTREYIEDHGWTQHMLRNDHGNVCGLGAVLYSQGWAIYNSADKVIEDPRYCWRVERILVNLLKLAEPHLRTYTQAGFIRWNDREGRTQQEVTDLLMKAEKLERGGDVDA